MAKATTRKDVNGMYSIQADEQQLNTLFRELLDGCRDDLNEAQSNVELFYEELTKSADTKIVYGSLYNEALRIKGVTRDRLLKLLNMFKDRVGTKERFDFETGKNQEDRNKTALTPEQMNAQIDRFLSSKVAETKVQLGGEKEEEAPTEENFDILIPNKELSGTPSLPNQQFRPQPDEDADDYEIDEDYVEGDEDFDEDDLG